MTILIIEDEKKLSDILKQALKGEKYAVEVAYDGEDGLAKAMKNNGDTKSVMNEDYYQSVNGETKKPAY